MTARGFRDVDARAAVALAAEGYRVIDVREPVEWQAGHVAGATHLPLGELPLRIGEVAPDRDAPILVHCAHGVRSRRAAAWLADRGYTNVANLDGSIDDWPSAGGAWEAAVTPDGRYARQVLIPEIGEDGQRRLGASRVLLVGVGGLGSPVALYLAAAGVGTIGLIDDDLVDESNLQRQVVHATDRIGMAKVESAELTLRALNPRTRVVMHRQRLTDANAETLIGDHDVIVDGSDNLEARYALNDAAVRLRRPVVHGSVYRWEGQVTTFVPFEGPCYRCLHPAPPPPDLAPACDVAGVLGVLPGIVGTLQAAEALKVLLGVGETLAGRLLMLDALGTTFDEIRIPRDPDCPSCGEAARYADERARAQTASV